MCEKHVFRIASESSSADGSLSIHEQRIHRRAAAHEEAIAVATAEAQVRAAFRKIDSADERPLWVEDGNAVL